MMREPAVQSWPEFAEAGDLDALGDLLRVGVVEDDHRRLAAQLEMHALQRVGCVARDQLSGRDVSGE